MSREQVDTMLKRAKAYAKQHGMSVDEVLLDFIYDIKQRPGDRLKAIELFKRCTMPRQSEQNVNITEHKGPELYLPEQKADPAKVVNLKAVE